MSAPHDCFSCDCDPCVLEAAQLLAAVNMEPEYPDGAF